MTDAIYIDQAEIAEKENILNRLRECLITQQDKFESYLDLLQKEEASIKSGELELLDCQIKMENKIVTEICSLQKVIIPLEDHYTREFPQKDSSLTLLQENLERMKQQVLEKSERNRNLFEKRMANLRQEITSIRRNVRKTSPYAKIPSSSILDISR